MIKVLKYGMGRVTLSVKEKPKLKIKPSTVGLE